MDLMHYDPFARWLGRRYEGMAVLMDRDDIYQITMLELIRSFDRHPDAPPSWHRVAMAKAVRQELTKQMRRLAAGPLDDQRRTPTPDSAERAAITAENLETIGRAMSALPDAEFQMVAFKLMGYSPVTTALRNGLPMHQAAQALRLGIKRMRAYVAELEVAM